MIKTYYWKGKKNFGDLLTPLLLQRFCHLEAQWVPEAEAELVMVGSVLDTLPYYYKGIVAGAGFLHEHAMVKMVAGNMAKVLAVRGPLTLKTLSIPNKQSIVLGDPGLLADELIPNQDKLYEVGLIPHWTDKSLELNPIFKRLNPRIIRVDDDPIKIITEIAQCKKIVSSSLHAVVLADAFGIPRRTELSPRVLSHPHQEGGDFKWRDYNLSIGMEFKTGVLQSVDRNIIIEKQNALFQVMEEVKALLS